MTSALYDVRQGLQRLRRERGCVVARGTCGVVGWARLVVLALAVLAALPGAAHAAASWDLFGLGEPRPPLTLPVKAIDERPFPFLADESRDRSVSIGTVTDGRLVNAMPLPLPGRTYSVLPRQLRRNLTYGTDGLMQALISASEYVERVAPGTITYLGNVGRREGGDIPWSVSHNSGRDADVAFFTTDPQGRPIAPPDLLHYRDDGRSREYGGYYRFDTARNWAYVKALILSPHAQMQHLFISDGLRARLLSHARATGEPASVIERASNLLRQPGAEIPHDDHLHVRVYCSRFDVGGGCTNSGRVQPGTDLFRTVRSARVQHARAHFTSGSTDVRAAAVRRLAMLGGESERDIFRAALSDVAAAVRVAGVDALADLGGAQSARAIVDHWESEDHPLVLLRSLEALGRIGGADAGRHIEQVLREPRVVALMGRSFDLRVVAADAAGAAQRAEPAYQLATLLGASDPELRDRAAQALSHVTNLEVADDDPRMWTEPQRLAQAARWQQWIADSADVTRDEWLDAGFAHAGYSLSGRVRADAPILARAAGDQREWVRTNAQLRLMAWTGNEPKSLSWSPRDARSYWTRWVRRNPRRVRGP